jgi:hypothetical protein
MPPNEVRPEVANHQGAQKPAADQDFKSTVSHAGDNATPDDVPAEPMTKGERDELVKIIRLNGKVARTGVGLREAELLAEVEAELSAVYSSNDEAWADVIQTAKDACAAADRHVAEQCRKLGIREEFRPSMGVQWYRRGENAEAERRAELRKLAQCRIAAAGKRAKAAIEAQEAELLTKIFTAGLTSGASLDFLASIPTASELMPVLTVAELETVASGGRST